MTYQQRISGNPELVNPTLATLWLEKNTKNRPVHDSKVKLYAERMRAGEWRLNGEAVIFDKNGDLIDGQHRLWAVIESGVTVQMLVVRGVDPDVRPTIDTGLSRSIRDVLAMQGDNEPPLGGALLYLYMYRQYPKKFGHTIGSLRPSHAKLLALLKQDPELLDSVRKWASSKPLRQFLAPSEIGFLHYLLSRIDMISSDTFFDLLATGKNLQETSAIWTLRSRLTNSKVGPHRLDTRTRVGMVFKTWNAWRQHRTLRPQQLAFGSGEKFPVIE